MACLLCKAWTEIFWMQTRTYVKISVSVTGVIELSVHKFLYHALSVVTILLAEARDHFRSGLTADSFTFTT